MIRQLTDYITDSNPTSLNLFAFGLDGSYVNLLDFRLASNDYDINITGDVISDVITKEYYQFTIDIAILNTNDFKYDDSIGEKKDQYILNKNFLKLLKSKNKIFILNKILIDKKIYYIRIKTFYIDFLSNYLKISLDVEGYVRGI